MCMQYKPGQATYELLFTEGTTYGGDDGCKALDVVGLSASIGCTHSG